MRLIKNNICLILSTVAIIFSIYTLLFKTEDNLVSPSRICFVETKRLMSEYIGLKVEQKKYDSIVEIIGKDLHDLIAIYQAKAKVFEQNKEGYNTNVRQKSLDELKDLERSIANNQEINKKKIEKVYNETVANVYLDITEYIKVYGKENNYDYILGSNIVAGDILYGAPVHNITDAILIKLNEKYYSKIK